MKVARTVRGIVALLLVLGLAPLGAAQAAVNKAPRIKKAEVKDKDGDGLGDRIVLTYNERINHKLDTRRFPFRVDGYKILKVNGARRSLKLVIVLKESETAPLKPAFVKYSRTNKQPVRDLKKKQAAKQLLNRNIIGLTATPPPPPEEDEFTLSVAKSGDGLGTVTDNHSKINCGTTCSASYPEGTSVTLTASPDAASKATFAGWTGACTGSTTTCTVTMDANKSVTAGFQKAGTFLLTVTKSGAGAADGTVTSTSTPTQPTQINCGPACTASYPKDTKVTLTATLPQGTAATWGGFTGGGCSGVSQTCEVTMTAAQNVTATFHKIGNFVLTVAKAGSGTGTVTSNDGKINCGADCTESYPAGTQITLTATPDQNMTFGGWSNGGCTGTTPTCQVTVNAAQTVTATFNSATTRQLTVEKDFTGEAGGDVTSTSSPSQPSQINCGATCQVNYPNDAVVTLTAAPDTESDFAGWEGGGCTGTSLQCNVTMDASKTVTASFVPKLPVATRTLTVTATGGTAACVPAAPSGGCNGSYAEGTSVVITATPAEDMDATSVVWEGCTPGVMTAPGNLVCTVVMDTDRSVSVTFTPLLGGATGLPDLPDVGGGLPIRY